MTRNAAARPAWSERFSYLLAVPCSPRPLKLTKNKQSVLKKQHSMQLHGFLKEDSPEWKRQKIHRVSNCLFCWLYPCGIWQIKRGNYCNSRSERRNLDSEIREKLSYVGRRQVLHRRGVNSKESLRRVKDKKSETLNSVLLLEEVKTRVRRPVPIKCERGARKTFSSRIACDPYVECVPRGRNFVNRQCPRSISLWWTVILWGRKV